MPWFKNLMVHRLNRDAPLRAEEMEEQLVSVAFTSCGSQDMAKMSWVPPMGLYSDTLTHTANNQIIICVREEEKIPSSPAIRQTLEAKTFKLETEQGHKLKKVEKDSLKDEILHPLLSRTFSRFGRTMMWADAVNDLVVVDYASTKKAESTLALLYEGFGSLPVVPLTMEDPAGLTLTEWVRSGIMTQGLQLLDEAEPKTIFRDNGVIHAKEQDPAYDEIAMYTEAGKPVTKLALSWQRHIRFVVCDSGSTEHLKFSDKLYNQNGGIDRGDYTQRFDTGFTLVMGELTAPIKSLVEGPGSEAQRQVVFNG